MISVFRGMGALVFAVLAWVVLFASAALAEEKIPEELYEKIYEETYTRVLVELHPEGGPHIPEGLLPSWMATEQRADIAAAQSKLLSDLSESDTLTLRQYGTVPMVALDVSIDGLTALETAPGVVAVRPDKLIEPNLAESVPLIEGDLAHARDFDGAGTVVAILDTGVEADHPFLSGKVVEEACYSRYSCPNGGSTQTGPGAAAPCGAGGCYHGTHVAGIAAGEGLEFTGIAPGADIMAVQVFSVESGDLGAYTSDIIAGLERVYELKDTHNIASANMSLGSYFTYDVCDNSSPTLKAVIDNLRSAGIATVISSGNQGDIGHLSYPACISSSVSVGSTTKIDEVSNFSNDADFLSLYAPGSDINSSLPGGTFGTLSGTSMAAPHVAGAFALLKQAKPGASVDEMLDAFKRTGKIIGFASWTTPLIRVNRAISHLFNKASITSPAPGTKFDATSATFTWTTPEGVGPYRLTVGTDVGLADIFSGGETSAASQAVGGITEDGEQVHVRLYSKVAGIWMFADYTYTAKGSPIPPAITSISPPTGQQTGQWVFIRGERFDEGLTTVAFGGVEATYVRVYSTTYLLARTPPHAPGAVDVTLTTPRGTATLAGGYTYLDTPGAVSIVTPTGAVAEGIQTFSWKADPSATKYTVIAYPLTAGIEANLHWDYTSAEAGCAGGTGVCAATPDRWIVPGSYLVWVRAFNDAGVGPDPAKWNTVEVVKNEGAGDLYVSGVYPFDLLKTEGGEEVEFIGKGFVPGETKVTIGGALAVDVRVVSPTKIAAISPAHTGGLVDLVVTTPEGSTTLDDAFFYGPPTEKPVAISPASDESITDATPTFRWNAPPGVWRYQLGIYRYNDSLGQFKIETFTLIYASDLGCSVQGGDCSYFHPVALEPGKYLWHLTTHSDTRISGYSQMSSYFTVVRKSDPLVIEPQGGYAGGGTPVHITGNGFVSGQTSVTFGGVAATSVAVTGPAALTAVAPEHVEGKVDVAVTTSGNTLTALEGFAFTPGPSQPEAISPKGVIFETTPTYQWRRVPGATYYRVRIHSNSSMIFDKSIPLETAGCNNGEEFCSLRPGTVIAQGLKLSEGKGALQVMPWRSSVEPYGYGIYGLSGWSAFEVKSGLDKPTNLTGQALSDTSINLTWTDNSDIEESHVIERRLGDVSDSNTVYEQIAVVGANATSYTDTGLAPSTRYTYRVRAAHPNGGLSSWSLLAAEVTKGVDVTNGTEVGQVTVIWSVEDGAVAYNLYRQACATCGKELIASSITGTQYVDTFAQAGVTYTYSLQSIDSGGAATDVAYTGTGCAQIPSSLSLSNRMFSEPVTIGATSTIVSGTNVTVGRDSRVTFHMRRATGGIRIGSGFRVQSGGSFRALVSTASGSCS